MLEREQKDINQKTRIMQEELGNLLKGWKALLVYYH